MLGPAPGGDDNLTHPRPAQSGQRLVGDVGVSQLVRVGRQYAGHIQRDVAVSNDNDPLVAEIDWQIDEIGMPVDPCHQFGGGAGAGQIHPVDVEAAVVGRARCVDDGVVMCEHVVVAELIADLDVEEEPELATTRDPVEQLGHPLGGLMIRRYPGPHQSVRGGQLFENIDPHALLGQQLVGGIHRGRPGPHDRHRQRAAVLTVDLRCRNHRRQFGCRRQLLISRTIRIETRVERDERQLLSRQAGVGGNGAHRARAHAGTAVHARHRIDVKHFSGSEFRLVRRWVNTVHRAGVDTGPVATARLGNNVRHRFLGSDRQVLALGLTAVARRLAVDLADLPDQLGQRVHQTRVAAQHPDVTEHVAQHLTRLG